MYFVYKEGQRYVHSYNLNKVTKDAT